MFSVVFASLTFTMSLRSLFMDFSTPDPGITSLIVVNVFSIASQFCFIYNYIQL